MNRTLIGLYAILCLLAAGRAWSEPVEPAAAPKPAADPAAAATPTGIYEEIEILRRLLNQGLKAAYGLPVHTGVQSFAVGSNIPLDSVRKGTDGHHLLGGAEGVYMKGCGVVYSATLAPPSRSPLPLAAGGTPAPPSAWDVARSELRGEKPRTPEAAAAERQVPLAEAVLHVLAENGRHFRHLADDERITVALTFRRSAACSQCHVGVGAWTPVVVARGNAYTIETPVWGAPQGGQQASSSEGNPSSPKEILVGDLHVRQRRLEDAAKAYQDALRALEQTSHGEKERTGRMEVKTLLGMVEAANKLAQVYTTQGNNERALHFLKIASRAAGLAEEAAQGKPVAAGTVPLPSRRMISAPKKILDQVGAGKMSFEEFRKAATVEYLTFPPADKDGKKDKTAASP
jgi:hypothetical protein